MRIAPWLYLVGSRQFGLSCPWDCHVYALRSDDGRTLLIDTGCGLGVDRIVTNLRAEFELGGEGAILLTHKHPDHAAGAAGLSRALGDWPVWCSSITRPIVEAGDNEASGLRGAQAQGGYPTELSAEPCPIAGTFSDGDVFELAGFRIRAIRVRGHSDDSFALWIEEKRTLMCGDILFYGGVLGVINTEDSGMQGYRADLGKLAGLGVEILLPGHGLFTLTGGQQHIDMAITQASGGFVPRLVGQGDLIF